MTNVFKKYGYYLVSMVELLTGFEDPALILRIFANSTGAEVRSVRLRKGKLIFMVRGKMDVWSVKETFIDRFYERYGTEIGDHWTIVDIGGGIGEFTLFAAAACPANRVLAFEPFDASFQLLKQNLEKNHIQNVQAYPVAIGAETGTIYLDTSSGEPLQFQSGGQPKSAAPLAVASISLKDMFEQYQIEQCDLLKLDCEGAEYPILFNTPASLFPRIQRIVMEYHQISTSAQQLALVSHLEQAGYQVRMQPNFVHDDLGYLYAFRPGVETQPRG